MQALTAWSVPELSIQCGQRCQQTFKSAAGISLILWGILSQLTFLEYLNSARFWEKALLLWHPGSWLIIACKLEKEETIWQEGRREISLLSPVAPSEHRPQGAPGGCLSLFHHLLYRPSTDFCLLQHNSPISKEEHRVNFTGLREALCPRGLCVGGRQCPLSGSEELQHSLYLRTSEIQMTSNCRQVLKISFDKTRMF